MKSNKKELSPKQREELLTALKARFEKNLNRHKGLDWAKVQARLEANAEKLWSLAEMERTGGEPDVVGQDKKSGEYIFFDCSEQTPQAVGAFATTEEALESRKEHKPKEQRHEHGCGQGHRDFDGRRIPSPARNWVSSTPSGRAGLKRRQTFVNSAARSMVSAVTTASSSATTARSLITSGRGFRGSLRV